MRWSIVIACITVMFLSEADIVQAAGQRALLIQKISAPPKADFMDAEDKARAIDLLGEEQAKEAIPALIDCLADTRALHGSDNWVGSHAVNALKKITTKDFGFDQKRWRTWFETSDFADNQCINMLLDSFKTAAWNSLKVTREASNRISLGFRTKIYQVDEKLRPIYPSGIKEVEGPTSDGFLVRLSIAPHNSLPMARNSNRYSERIERRPYWTLRTYGFELQDGCLVVGIEQGSAAPKDLLNKVEQNIADVIDKM